MSTLTEIEAAVTDLPDDEKRTLLRFLVESMPRSLPTPEPREFSVEQMRSWIEQDEREFEELIASGKLKR